VRAEKFDKRTNSWIPAVGVLVTEAVFQFLGSVGELSSVDGVSERSAGIGGNRVFVHDGLLEMIHNPLFGEQTRGSRTGDYQGEHEHGGRSEQEVVECTGVFGFQCPSSYRSDEPGVIQGTLDIPYPSEEEINRDPFATPEPATLTEVL
jgi:hypothetical protein